MTVLVHDNGFSTHHPCAVIIRNSYIRKRKISIHSIDIVTCTDLALISPSISSFKLNFIPSHSSTFQTYSPETSQKKIRKQHNCIRKAKQFKNSIKCRNIQKNTIQSISRNVSYLTNNIYGSINVSNYQISNYSTNDSKDESLHFPIIKPMDKDINPFLLIHEHNKYFLNPKTLPNSVIALKYAFSQEDMINDHSWLTSTFMDIILLKLALLYPSVSFLSTDFVHLHLNNKNIKSNNDFLMDIVGNKINYYNNNKSIIFPYNVNNIHWNLLRLQFLPFPELQLFEPIGKPKRRFKKTISLRSLPRNIIHWLDLYFPLNTIINNNLNNNLNNKNNMKSTWLEYTVSAITKQHQFTGFDCGIACLLYAAKCGQGQTKEMIDEYTDQTEITIFRKKLLNELKTFQQENNINKENNNNE